MNRYSKIGPGPLIPFVFLLSSVFGSVSAQVHPQGGLSGPYLGQKPPGEIPEIFAPGIVSTEMYNHSSLSISPEGDEIYWAMSPLDTPRRIYCSSLEGGTWSEPEIVHFTQNEDGDCPVLSPDGSKMYFNSNRPVGKDNSRRERIWCVNRVAGKWGRPFPLDTEINGQHLHWQVSVDKAGNLYFGSERTGSMGKDDIFYAEYSDGALQKPVSLGGNINSGEHESTPYISPDGEYLVFNRNGLQISFKDQDGQWEKAIPLGDSYDGICPYVSPDGKYIFFLKMGKGYNDIYWVPAKVIKDLRSGVK